MNFSTVPPHSLAHPRQRNRTRLLPAEDGRVCVAKEYAHLCGEDVEALCRIERRLRSAGVPMPEMLDWSADLSSTVHEYVDGQHSTEPTPLMIESAVEVFAKQLKVLRRQSAPWTPPRPVGLPIRSREAAVAASSTSLRNAIVSSWRKLSHLAQTQPLVTTHGDWRADNLLFDADAVIAVLDWEIIIDLPLAEAVGYAAASLTHSWRPDLRRLLDPTAITTFLNAAERLGVLTAVASGHARLAALHIAAVRVVEDETDGIATPTLTELTRHLGARS